MKRNLFLATVLGAAIMVGCGNAKPPCAPGRLHPDWTKPPLAALVPTDATICQIADAEGATRVLYWQAGRVHDANVGQVGTAQSNGWERTGDNWYHSRGDFDSPKWSTFTGDLGKLRLDVREAGGGALVDWHLSASSAPGSGAEAPATHGSLGDRANAVLPEKMRRARTPAQWKAFLDSDYARVLRTTNASDWKALEAAAQQ